MWQDKKRKGNLYKDLRRKDRRYLKQCKGNDYRGRNIGRVGNENRTKEAEKRNVFDHYEGDTIIGKNHKESIITLNERASGMLWMKKVESRDQKLSRKNNQKC